MKTNLFVTTRLWRGHQNFCCEIFRLELTMHHEICHRSPQRHTTVRARSASRIVYIHASRSPQRHTKESGQELKSALQVIVTFHPRSFDCGTQLHTVA